MRFFSILLLYHATLAQDGFFSVGLSQTVPSGSNGLNAPYDLLIYYRLRDQRIPLLDKVGLRNHK